MQRTVIIIGLVVLVAGLLWPWISRIPLGRLPGDLIMERSSFRIYFPLTTMILVSVVISLILWLLRR
ncbi:MAG: hypothetical protein CMM56_02060 [Rhodospirillaceae bacterium]|jgi:hypothetical protein|nr:hypothetical protein [Gammaproteobacteria bacterium]MBH97216.1 hypothetical protein [Rhodospirillaceae bacterium]